MTQGKTMMMMIVIGEHTLAYQREGAAFPSVLRASGLRGSPWNDLSGSVAPYEDVREATRQDFEDFGVVVDAYLTDDNYKFDKS